MSTEKQLSLITVNYNSSFHVLNLVKSTKHIRDIIKEIIVIDNSSRDRSLLNILDSDKIKIIYNNENIGFSRAVNQGIKLSKSNFILLLNPDCLIPDKSLLKSFKFLIDHKNTGAVGGKILDVRGKVKYSANSKPSLGTALFEFTNLKKVFPRNKFTNDFWVEKNKSISKPTKVSSLCGAYIIFKKRINSENLLFNEKYFLYLEDIDFGIRLNKMGFDVIFDPRSQIQHIGGQSNTSKYGVSLKHWYKSRKILFNEILPRPYSCIISFIYNLEETLLFIYHSILHEPTE